MISVRDKELELKFELTHEQLQRIEANPVVRDLTVGQPTTRTLRSIYFDTPDQRLRVAGLSLRIRSDGETWVQTVKSGTRVTNGVSNPGEFETAVAAPEPDLKSIKSAKLRRKIARLLDGSILEPVFETVVTRTARRLHTASSDIELALDEGVVRSGEAEQPLCEAELELKSGTTDGLLEIAAKLIAETPVRLADASKADRGYDLAIGRTEASPKPEHAEPVELDSGATCAEALGLFVASASRQIAANRAVVLDSEDPEGPHQLRIGLRRLRSAVRVFRPLIDTSSTHQMDNHAREIGLIVGELRDADVLIDEIYAPVAGTMGGHAGLRPLRDALDAHRAQMRLAARSGLQAHNWSTLQLYLVLWPRTLENARALSAPVGEFAGKALAKSWKKVAKRGKRFARLDDEQRHKMRKSLKELRYASEFFASLYGDREVRPFLKQVRKLQHAFGHLNDVANAGRLESVAAEHCASSAPGQRAAGYVLGWHRAQTLDCWNRAEKGWNDLKRHCFWQ